jgi:hypothetical protein
MRTAQEIYDAYRIMPNLQMHQLRVAAVGRIVAEHFSEPLDAKSVVLACLFHDMGNIIKFDFTTLPEFLEPEGLSYWQRSKDEWIATYGHDEHAASLAVAKEIGLSEDVQKLIDETRFSRLEAARDGVSFEQKLVKYADLRAAPLGILPLLDRLEEGRVRYAERKGYNTPEGREKYRLSTNAAIEIEKQIFEHCSIKPEDINDASVAPLIEKLRTYGIAD